MQTSPIETATTEMLSELLKTARRVHFIAIGGISMSGLARLLLSKGWQITGSDLADSATLTELQRLGARVAVGHSEKNLGEADLVIFSDAIAPDNPELLAAKAKGIPVFRRSQLLGELTAGLRTIAVSGTHGKTTTTAMIAEMLSSAGLSPTMFLGGEYPPLGGNACIGKGEWAVVEACEAFASFLDLSPAIAVITNLEPEHMDYHGSEEALKKAFINFLARVKRGGTAVVNLDTPGLLYLAHRAGVINAIGFTLHEESSVQTSGIETVFRATKIVLQGAGSETVISRSGEPVARLKLPVPGRHNVANALAAISAASVAGIEPQTAADALQQFLGVQRRFQIIARKNGIMIVDDYAHHPTELAAAIAAARGYFSGRLLVIFQPHLYSRTQFFMRDFARVLSAANLAWVTDIYPAREAPIPGVDAGKIAEIANAEFGGKVAYLPFADVVPAVMQQLQEGDIVITMGAGNVDRIARGLADVISTHLSPER